MRGIILAGGTGARLYPLTYGLSKQLLAVYDKPMIYYPLSALMLADVREILIITTPHELSQFQHLLGDGSQWGLELSYKIQENPRGVAEAFMIAESFIAGHRSVLILGDNIFYGHGLPELLKRAASTQQGAAIFGYYVSDPSAYGVVEFNRDGQPIEIIEKPENPISNWAVPGVYFYDRNVVEIAKSVKPSIRGELEITSINKVYLQNKQLEVLLMGRGIAWLDAGTPDALLMAANFVSAIQWRQGLLVCSPEEIAYRKGFIGDLQFEKLAYDLRSSEYGRMVVNIPRNGIPKACNEISLGVKS